MPTSFKIFLIACPKLWSLFCRLFKQILAGQISGFSVIYTNTFYHNSLHIRRGWHSFPSSLPPPLRLTLGIPFPFSRPSRTNRLAYEWSRMRNDQIFWPHWVARFSYHNAMLHELIYYILHLNNRYWMLLNYSLFVLSSIVDRLLGLTSPGLHEWRHLSHQPRRKRLFSRLLRSEN